jgi:hypothetical protein
VQSAGGHMDVAKLTDQTQLSFLHSCKFSSPAADFKESFLSYFALKCNIFMCYITELVECLI